ncbi:MAG: vitamin B12 dependent-methionine synthase activation domain-containing protein [Candidatus Omnitrophota bacterium]
MENLIKTITIDWDWVKTRVSTREKLTRIHAVETKEALLDSLGKALEEARSKAAPKIAIVKKFIAKFETASFTLEDGPVISTKELSAYIKGANHIYAFLATIGKDVEEKATSYMNGGDHLSGYLLDRIGSFAVESMAKNAEDALRRKLQLKNLSVSMRFSPGYCDWPIEEQSKIAQIIDFSSVGVTLTQSCVMVPRKSITAVVAVGPGDLFKDIRSPCAVCNMRVCDYRRKD